MNYYYEIKNQFINNEITKRVKDYSKNIIINTIKYSSIILII